VENEEIMNIDTQDKLSAQINQARGVLAALLADTCDLKRGSNLSTEMQNNALWAVDSLLEQLEQTLQTGMQAYHCLPK
jgi:hypothetical protein